MGLDLRIFGTLCSCLVAIRPERRKDTDTPSPGEPLPRHSPSQSTSPVRDQKPRTDRTFSLLATRDYENPPLACQGKMGGERLS